MFPSCLYLEERKERKGVVFLSETKLLFFFHKKRLGTNGVDLPVLFGLPAYTGMHTSLPQDRFGFDPFHCNLLSDVKIPFILYRNPFYLI
jgi:hypothetical protein